MDWKPPKGLLLVIGDVFLNQGGPGHTKSPGISLSKQSAWNPSFARTPKEYMLVVASAASTQGRKIKVNCGQACPLSPRHSV